MGLREKLRPTYSNIHLVFHSSISCFHKISIKKNTTPNTSNPQIPAHTKYWSLCILRGQDVPRVMKVGANSPTAFFNHPINCSSFLELPFFSKEVMLRSVRKAFWEACPGFLRLLQSFHDEPACINEALNAVHETGLSPAVQPWSRLVHALLPAKFRHLVHQLLKALLLGLHLDEMPQLRVDWAHTQRGEGRRGGIHPSAAPRPETDAAPTHVPPRRNRKHYGLPFMHMVISISMFKVLYFITFCDNS